MRPGRPHFLLRLLLVLFVLIFTLLRVRHLLFP